MSSTSNKQQPQNVTLSQATQAWRKLLSGYTKEEREVIQHRPVVLSTENMNTTLVFMPSMLMVFQSTEEEALLMISVAQ